MHEFRIKRSSRSSSESSFSYRFEHFGTNATFSGTAVIDARLDEDVAIAQQVLNQLRIFVHKDILRRYKRKWQPKAHPNTRDRKSIFSLEKAPYKRRAVLTEMQPNRDITSEIIKFLTIPGVETSYTESNGAQAPRRVTWASRSCAGG